MRELRAVNGPGAKMNHKISILDSRHEQKSGPRHTYGRKSMTQTKKNSDVMHNDRHNTNCKPDFFIDISKIITDL
jgi:hypothetical protein